MNASPRFLSYTLFPLLPQEQTVILDQKERLLLLMTAQPASSAEALLKTVRLTAIELALVRTLLDAYPRRAKQAHLLAAMQGETHQYWIQRLKEARAQGGTETVMAPVRKVIPGINNKLHPFGLSAASLTGKGYILIDAESDGDGYEQEARKEARESSEH